MVPENFRFIDLFSGIGGFHQAMVQLGGTCVFASEIDKKAVETYKINYGIDSNINIKDIKVEDIPEHDVLCAGFPCQPFSRAGKKQGFQDETKGTLFFEIERILKYHKTKYIILENVRAILSNDNGNTWKTIKSHLISLGYRLTEEPIIISPHNIGIPQLRNRVVIVGLYDPEHIEEPLEISLPKYKNKKENSIYDILETDEVDEKYNITPEEERLLAIWDEFFQGVKENMLGFRININWFQENPDNASSELEKIVIQKNNKLYENNQEFIDFWLKKYNYLEEFSPTYRCLDWSGNGKLMSIWDGLIQFRPSGVRVKTPTCFPALVAMVQIPIIGKYKRRLTVREAARLQSFPDTFIPNSNDQQAYKQFGNAVNVEVIKVAAEKLFEY